MGERAFRATRMIVPSIYSVRHVNIELMLGPIHHGQHDVHDT